MAKSQLCKDLFVKISEDIRREEAEAMDVDDLEYNVETEEEEEPLVPYRASFEDISDDVSSSSSGSSSSSSVSMHRGASFASRGDMHLGGDQDGGVSSSAAPSDPHRDSGPVILLVALIVGVVLVFFTCITCCSVGGGSSSSSPASPDAALQSRLDAYLVEQALQAGTLAAASDQQQQQAAASTPVPVVAQKRSYRSNIQNLYYNNLCWASTHAASFDTADTASTAASSCHNVSLHSIAAANPSTTKKNTSAATEERRRHLLKMHRQGQLGASLQEPLLHQHHQQQQQHQTLSPKLERLLGESHGDIRRGLSSSATGSQEPIGTTATTRGVARACPRGPPRASSSFEV